MCLSLYGSDLRWLGSDRSRGVGDGVLGRLFHGVQFVDDWGSVDVRRSGLLWALVSGPLGSLLVDVLGEAYTVNTASKRGKLVRRQYR